MLPGEPEDSETQQAEKGLERGGVSLSLVVPVFDEEENLPKLHAEIAHHVGGMGVSWEVVYVDDRSGDRSFDVLMALLWRWRIAVPTANCRCQKASASVTLFNAVTMA